MTRERLPMSRRSGHRWAVLFALAAIVVAAPAAATDRFADVPTDSVHHDAIGELADAGVTAGCGDDRFCPGTAVRRGQMASLFTSALPRAMTHDGVAALSGDGELTGVPASVTVRTSGVAGGRGRVTLQGSVSVLSSGNVSSCPCEVEAFVYRETADPGPDDQGPSMWAQLPGEATGSGRAATALPVSWTVDIASATTETFRIAVFVNDGAPTEVTAEAELTAVTTPLS